MNTVVVYGYTVQEITEIMIENFDDAEMEITEGEGEDSVFIESDIIPLQKIEEVLGVLGIECERCG